ncbi:MAG: RIP metalloprotease RseP [Chitinophagales bacterium]|nr:RIP metalloprotease RseP [Chitinophagales bacterium]MCZ2394478.1 RIP metalloprotease RseP [Chitinophagales bacterium]
MEDILIRAGQFLLSLTLLVFLHELGHFIPAKLFKVRVSKFYVFFDFLFPLPKVLNFSLFKKKWGGTEYGIGWFPLGGYVQIDGMVDESMDTEKLKEAPEPWEFRAKPTWQRLIIMIGGVTVNIIVAMLIYMGILYYWGESYLPMKNATNGIMVSDSLGYELGFQNGDKILSVNQNPVEKFNEFTKILIIDDAKTIEINRAGVDTSINVPDDIVAKILSKSAKTRRLNLIEPRIPIEVKELQSGRQAEKAGLKVQDRVVGVNDVPTFFFDEMYGEFQKNKGNEVALQIVRNGENLTLNVRLDSNGTIGFIPEFEYDKFYDIAKVDYGLLSAIPGGIRLAITSLSDYVKQMKLLFNGTAKVNESAGGFISIAKVFGTEWDWFRFWNMTAMISVILAFMNILPIPALDGGHVMFLLYEMIFRKPPPLKFMEVAQMIGMAILLGAMLYFNGLDFFREFFK